MEDGFEVTKIGTCTKVAHWVWGTCAWTFTSQYWVKQVWNNETHPYPTMVHIGLGVTEFGTHNPKKRAHWAWDNKIRIHSFPRMAHIGFGIAKIGLPEIGTHTIPRTAHSGFGTTKIGIHTN